MKEREQILALWRDMRSSGETGVLVTVVKTLGSSYRRPGARLLIAESGRHVGSISGGCLEQDVLKKSWWLTEKGRVIRRYDTTPEGEIGPAGEVSGGFGLGCNGIIYLAMERLANDGASALDVMERVHKTRQFEVYEHGLGNGEVFCETLVPPVRLFIFGAGDDAVALTEAARFLGWEVFVFDGRAHYARREKFPLATEVGVRDSNSGLDDLQIDTRTAAVVMSHSYSQDLNFLKSLAGKPAAYLGILGPRNRSLQLLKDAGLDMNGLPGLHGPVGLDIGADGAEQVALSIVAEIQATLNGREGGSLRARAGSIHSGEFTPSIVCA